MRKIRGEFTATSWLGKDAPLIVDLLVRARKLKTKVKRRSRLAKQSHRFWTVLTKKMVHGTLTLSDGNVVTRSHCSSKRITTIGGYALILES